MTVNEHLLKQARALKITLSQVLERGLAEEVRQARRAQWLEENREAVADYNARVASRGVFSDGLRRF